MKLGIGWISFFTLTILSGCNSQNNQNQVELNNNTETWSESGIINYSYEYGRSCFCPQQEDLVVVIENSAVAEAFYTPSGVYLTEEELELALTIDELFDVAQQAINDNVASLSVTYNADFGYPERISIDVDEAIADDEITHIVTEFQ